MPLFMDRHRVPEGTAPEDLAAAHEMDLKVQDKYGVRYLTYWFDRGNGGVFCLVDAPSAEKAVLVHREAHGLEPEAIMPVEQQDMTAFLGRDSDPPDHKPGEPIVDSAFRTIVFTDIAGSTSTTQRIGDEAAMHLLRTHNDIVRGALDRHGGREIKHTGDGIMACFTSVTGAVESAIEIQQELHEHNSSHGEEAVHVRLGMSAGEPVSDEGDLFGAAVQLARRICDHADPGRIFTSNVIRELSIGKGFRFRDLGESPLKGFEEPVRVHEVLWLSE